MVDPIARAYATIGVPRGASARELKRQYRRLVRQWHPDRWANDPVGQAEASNRMRIINDAYATLERLGPPEPQRTAAGRPDARALTKEELDAIVRAIGTESPVMGATWIVIGVMPIIAAFFLIQPRRGVEYVLIPPSGGDLLMAMIFFAFGAAVLMFRRR